MRVHELSPAPGSNKRKKRVGRGIGGKGGKTAGAGTKGQHSRGRGKVNRGFEGGQTGLKQRVPKLKGFNNPFRVEYNVVNLDTLADRFDAGAVVTPEVDIARYPDLLIGVVPVINLEWIQKIHRDNKERGYTADKEQQTSRRQRREEPPTDDDDFQLPGGKKKRYYN